MKPFRREGIIRTQRGWLLSLGVPLTLLDGLLVHETRGWMTILAGVGLLVFALAPALLFHFLPKVRRGTITVDAENVLVDGQPVIALSQLRDGRRHTNNGRATAWLQPRLRHGFLPYRIELASDADVDAFIEAVRLARRHRVTKMPVVIGSSREALPRRILFALLGLAIGAAMFALVPAAHVPSWMYGLLAFPICAFYFGATVLLGGESVTIGSDGLLLRRSFFRKRFVPYAAIAHAEAKDEAVKLQLTTAEVIPMSFPLALDGAAYAKDLAAAIEQARAEQTTTTIPEKTTAALLGRNGRPAREWMEALRHLADDRTSYRATALAPERLWTILEDPAASPTARAGAAFALQGRINDGERARLRIASDACAAPTLRIALDAAASSNEGALADALDALDDDGGATSRRTKA